MLNVYVKKGLYREKWVRYLNRSNWVFSILNFLSYMKLGSFNCVITTSIPNPL